MFVRVRHRKSLVWWKKDEGYLSAYLVSSVRTKNGPRHRQRGYCGTISLLRGQPASLWSLHWFWAKAEARLAALGLPREQEEKLRATLRQKVGPCPSQEELEADKREMVARIEEAVARFFSLPPLP